MCFRLEKHSEAHVLWNHYFLGKKKKEHIKSTIDEVIKLARERIGDKGHFAVFLIKMRDEYDSDQKAFDRIFELALERYLELQGKGQVPVLMPHRVVTPRTEPRAQPIERETIETPQKKTLPSTSLETVKAWFSSDLKNVLTFDYQDGKAILRTTEWLTNGRWERIMAIVNEHGGEWISAGKESRWVIPLE